jgi:hypothetical protein
MKENLLQFIWQFQYYNKESLLTSSGEAIQIIHPGQLNKDQGPDFKEARIKINNTIWAGNIELHINSSDWNLHNHTADDNYKNIILHVVWNHDKEITDKNKTILQTLELQPRVSKLLLNKYESLMSSTGFIPCRNQINSIKDITLLGWKHRLLIERLQSKSARIFTYLKENKNHWEETFWWAIARNFGIRLNSEVFENIAKSLKVNILAKHKSQVIQIEALLLGQAGLLNCEFKEQYPQLLMKEYFFLKKKYNLKQPQMQLVFHRMRPANFPTVRLAQLSMLIHQSLHLFSKIIDEENVSNIKKLLNVTANDYWHYHYVLDEPTELKKKSLGKQMINNILINTIIPLVFSYGLYHKEDKYKDKAIKWLEEIEAETNSITKGFNSIGQASKSSFDSQSYIQLKNEYCDHKRCLDCAIGNSLIRS